MESFQKKLCQSKSLVWLANKFQTEHSVCHTVSTTDATIAARKIGVTLKKSMHGVLLENWKGKSLHGRFFERLNKPFVDKKRSLSWLNSSGLRGISEEFTCATQGQCLKTRNYSKHFM